MKMPRKTEGHPATLRGLLQSCPFNHSPVFYLATSSNFLEKKLAVRNTKKSALAEQAGRGFQQAERRQEQDTDPALLDSAPHDLLLLPTPKAARTRPPGLSSSWGSRPWLSGAASPSRSGPSASNASAASYQGVS